MCQRARLADDRYEVARIVQRFEEVQPCLAGFFTRCSPGRHACRQNSQDCLVRRARITRQRHLSCIFGLQKISPILRHILDEVLVHDKGHHTVIVAIPMTIGVLDAIRNFVPGGNFVGLRQTLGLGGRTEGKAHVDDVGGLRALVVLVGLDRFDLVGGPGVGVQLVDGDFRILGLEAVDDSAVSAPVMRQRDGRQRAFGLGSGLDLGN